MGEMGWQRRGEGGEVSFEPAQRGGEDGAGEGVGGTDGSCKVDVIGVASGNCGDFGVETDGGFLESGSRDLVQDAGVSACDDQFFYIELVGWKR